MISSLRCDSYHHASFLALPWSGSGQPDADTDIELCEGHAHQLSKLLAVCQANDDGSGSVDENGSEFMPNIGCTVAGRESLILSADPVQCDGVANLLNTLVHQFTMGPRGSFICEADGLIKSAGNCDADTVILNDILVDFQAGNFVGCDFTTVTTTLSTTATSTRTTTATSTATTTPTTTPYEGKVECFSTQLSTFLSIPNSDSCSRQAGFMNEVIVSCATTSVAGRYFGRVACSEVEGHQVLTLPDFDSCQGAAYTLNTALQGYIEPFVQTMMQTTIGCSPAGHLIDLECDTTSEMLNEIILAHSHGLFDGCRITTPTTTQTTSVTTSSTSTATSSLTSSATTSITTSHTTTLTTTHTTTITTSQTTSITTSSTTTRTTSQTSTQTTSPVVATFRCHPEGYLTLTGSDDCQAHVRVLNEMVGVCNEGPPSNMQCANVLGMNEVLMQDLTDCPESAQGVNRAISGHQMGEAPATTCSPAGYIRFATEAACASAVNTLNQATNEFQDGTFVDCVVSTATTSATTSQTSTSTTSGTTTLSTTPTSTDVNSKYSCAEHDGHRYLAVPSHENCDVSVGLMNSLVDACVSVADASTPALNSRSPGEGLEWSCNSTVLSSGALLQGGAVDRCNLAIAELTEIFDQYAWLETGAMQLRCSPSGFVEVAENTDFTCDSVAALINTIILEYEYGFFDGCRQSTPTTTGTTSLTSTLTTTDTSTATTTQTTTPTLTPIPITIVMPEGIQAELVMSAVVGLAGLDDLSPAELAAVLGAIQSNLAQMLGEASTLSLEMTVIVSASEAGASGVSSSVNEPTRIRRGVAVRKRRAAIGLAAEATVLYASFADLAVEKTRLEDMFGRLFSDAVRLGLSAGGIMLPDGTLLNVEVAESETYGVEPESSSGGGFDSYQSALIALIILVVVLCFVFSIAFLKRKKNAIQVAPQQKLSPERKASMLAHGNGNRRRSRSRSMSRSSMSPTKIMPAPFVPPSASNADFNPFDTDSIKDMNRRAAEKNRRRSGTSRGSNKVHVAPSPDMDGIESAGRRMGGFGKANQEARRQSTNDPFSSMPPTNTFKPRSSSTLLALDNTEGINAPRRQSSTQDLQQILKTRLPTPPSQRGTPAVGPPPPAPATVPSLRSRPSASSIHGKMPTAANSVLSPPSYAPAQAQTVPTPHVGHVPNLRHSASDGLDSLSTLAGALPAPPPPPGVPVSAIRQATNLPPRPPPTLAMPRPGGFPSPPAPPPGGGAYSDPPKPPGHGMPSFRRGSMPTRPVRPTAAGMPPFPQRPAVPPAPSGFGRPGQQALPSRQSGTSGRPAGIPSPRMPQNSNPLGFPAGQPRLK